MARRYSGSLCVYIRAMDLGGMGPRYYYEGTVTGPEAGQGWAFRELSPSPCDAPGPEGLAIDDPLAYDRAAAVALQWAQSDGDEDRDWVLGSGDFDEDHSAEYRFRVSRSKV